MDENDDTLVDKSSHVENISPKIKEKTVKCKTKNKKKKIKISKSFSTCSEDNNTFDIDGKILNEYLLMQIKEKEKNEGMINKDDEFIPG